MTLVLAWHPVVSGLARGHGAARGMGNTGGSSSFYRYHTTGSSNTKYKPLVAVSRGSGMSVQVDYWFCMKMTAEMKARTPKFAKTNIDRGNDG